MLPASIDSLRCGIRYHADVCVRNPGPEPVIRTCELKPVNQNLCELEPFYATSLLFASCSTVAATSLSRSLSAVVTRRGSFSTIRNLALRLLGFAATSSSLATIAFRVTGWATALACRTKAEGRECEGTVKSD